MYRLYIIKGYMHMMADRIKDLRGLHNLTQSDVAKMLEVTRSSVNAWEMGISTPSTKCIVQLARLFGVSTDYLLGMENNLTLDISGLDDESVKILAGMVQFMRGRR